MKLALLAQSLSIVSSIFIVATLVELATNNDNSIQYRRSGCMGESGSKGLRKGLPGVPATPSAQLQN